MPTDTSADNDASPAQPATPQGINIRLVPSGQSEQPIVANVTSIHPASGMLFIDFGFIEPGALQGLAQLARAGKKVPQQMDARLSARLALAYDTAASLHQQLGKLLEAAAKARTR